MRPIHTHTHTLHPPISFSIALSSSLLLCHNVSFTHSISRCLHLSLLHRQKHTTLTSTHNLILLPTRQVMQKTQGKLFFFLFFLIPGRKKKTAKCNNLGQKCWHLKMRLQLRRTTRLQLKWAGSETQTDRLTPLSLRASDPLILPLLFPLISPIYPPFLSHYFTHLYFPFMLLSSTNHIWAAQLNPSVLILHLSWLYLPLS